MRDTKIRVSDVLHLLASGMTQTQLLKEMPALESDDIAAALRYAEYGMEAYVARTLGLAPSPTPLSEPAPEIEEPPRKSVHALDEEAFQNSEMPTPTCERCDVEMEEGHGAYGTDAQMYAPMWIAGVPEFGILGGLKYRDRLGCFISIYRCPRCGRLENYAWNPRE